MENYWQWLRARYLPGIVLSNTMPIRVPRNILVLSKTVRISSAVSFPEIKGNILIQPQQKSVKQTEQKRNERDKIFSPKKSFVFSLAVVTILAVIHDCPKDERVKQWNRKATTLTIIYLTLSSADMTVQNHPPVSMASGCCSSHHGKDNPRNMEEPKMKRFRDEFISTYCKLEIPTATMIPVFKNVTMESCSLVTASWATLCGAKLFFHLKINCQALFFCLNKKVSFPHKERITKQGSWGTANDGIWNGHEHSSKLPQNSKQHHQNCTGVDHPPRANLHKQWKRWFSSTGLEFFPNWAEESPLLHLHFNDNSFAQVGMNSNSIHGQGEWTFSKTGISKCMFLIPVLA